MDISVVTTCAHLIFSFLTKKWRANPCQHDSSPGPVSKRSIIAVAVWPFLCAIWFFYWGVYIHIGHYNQVTLTPLCNKYLTWSFAELVQSMRTELRLVLLKTLRACTSRLINVLIWNNYIFFNSLDMSILKPILYMKISSSNKVRRP